MSMTLNNSDFQCLQDQLVDLKTKNYELAEKNRRRQADFEAAKAKICSLQLKLEEQERDFQVTSTTLRREIEAMHAASNGAQNTTTNNSINEDSENNNNNKDEDYKTRYKKLLHKAKELQQRYEKSVGVIQQMNEQIRTLTSKASKLEEENKRLGQEFAVGQQKIEELEQGFDLKLQAAIEEHKQGAGLECEEQLKTLETIKVKRDNLECEVNHLRHETRYLMAKIESLAEERKIQDKKGAQMIKELKRQLTIEKNLNETLQKRLEKILSEPSAAAASLSTLDLADNKTRLSTSSNDNSRGSRGASGSGNNTNHRDDSNSVSSWSLVAKGKSSTPSVCSIESDGRETVQSPASSNMNTCDTFSLSSQQQQSPSSKSVPRLDLVANAPNKQQQRHPSSTSLSQNSSNCVDFSRPAEGAFGLKFEDQAALIERVTRLQHDKWTLEEKLSYMEQANGALTQDLADKSQIVRQYFMDQAIKSAASQHHNQNHPTCLDGSGGSHFNQQDATSAIYGPGMSSSSSSSRRVSFPNNFNQLITDKPSLKKMVDFIKERGPVSSIVSGGGDSENITREAIRKMQIMLEETLIKCLKLQENLDSLTKDHDVATNKYHG